jgi:hypothetical protein
VLPHTHTLGCSPFSLGGFKVGTGTGKKVHLSVKIISFRNGDLEAKVGVADTMDLFLFFKVKLSLFLLFFWPQVGVLEKSSFSSEGLRLPEKVDMERTSVAKSVAMLVAMLIFHLEHYIRYLETFC